MISSLSLNTSSKFSSSSVFYFKICSNSSHWASSSLISFLSYLYWAFFSLRSSWSSFMIAVFYSISKMLISISCFNYTISSSFLMIYLSLLIIRRALRYISSNKALLSLSKSLYCVTFFSTSSLIFWTSSSVMFADFLRAS